MRLASDVRQKLLDQNEGYTTSTSYSGKNSSEDRHYEIRGGQVHIREIGNTSWGDSRYDNIRNRRR